MKEQCTSPKKILIVEDSPEIGKRLCAMLSGLGNVEVVGPAEDGSEALRLQGYYRPDVILLDLQLPGVSGLDLLTALRQRSQTSVIIVLTNHDGAQFRRRSLEAGANHFLSKANEFEHVAKLVLDQEEADL